MRRGWRRPHAEWSDSRAKATFLVEWRGEPAGSVDVRRRSDGVGVLSWVTYAPYRGRGVASRAVRLLVDWAFDELGLRRVEAEVNPLNRASLRTAHRAGLRREGLLRGNTTLAGEVHDTVLLGRLVDDPPPGTREGFTALLDSSLPTKRAIAQGVLRAGPAVERRTRRRGCCSASSSTSGSGTCRAASSTAGESPARLRRARGA